MQIKYKELKCGNDFFESQVLVGFIYPLVPTCDGGSENSGEGSNFSVVLTSFCSTFAC